MRTRTLNSSLNLTESQYREASKGKIWWSWNPSFRTFRLYLNGENKIEVCLYTQSLIFLTEEQTQVVRSKIQWVIILLTFQWNLNAWGSIFTYLQSYFQWVKQESLSRHLFLLWGLFNYAAGIFQPTAWTWAGIRALTWKDFYLCSFDFI